MPKAPEPATVDMTTWRLTRIGGASNPVRFAQLDPSDAALWAGGNRFDVVGGGVLYAADDSQTAFREVLRGFRPTAAALAAPDPGMRPANVIPASWRARKSIVKFELAKPTQFLDLTHPATHAVLTAELAAELAARNIDRVDVSVTMSPDRTLTRLFSHWAYVQNDARRSPLYGGLAYASRTDGHVCLAVFDSQTVYGRDVYVIQRDDPDLQEAAQHYGLEIE